MQNQGRQLFSVPWFDAILSIFSKLVIVPLLMVALAKAFKLSDEAGRAAVLIAALPISMAAFSLGAHYALGEAILSENIALGTILMLPTILVWSLILDKLSLFPISSTSSQISNT
jgi:predicted permease